MDCAICHARRPRRFCPGVKGDICTTCCGAEREVTVHCPLDCEFLQEARKHDKAPPVGDVPNLDIRVSESLLRANEKLFVFVSSALAKEALAMPGVADFDVRAALDSLIRTYRSLQSGIYYESLPDDPSAANLCRAVQDAVAAFRKAETEHLGMRKTRDADVLGLLVFLQRWEMERNNGRRLGRAFLDALRGIYPVGEEPPAPPASSLILP